MLTNKTTYHTIIFDRTKMLQYKEKAPIALIFKCCIKKISLISVRNKEHGKLSSETHHIAIVMLLLATINTINNHGKTLQ